MSYLFSSDFCIIISSSNSYFKMKVNHYIYSGARGSYGGVVEQKWLDKQVLRTKPTSVSNPNTVAQQLQRTKFSKMQALSRILSVVFSIGLRSMATSMTLFNAFMTSNLKTALTGSTPETVEIDYNALIVAKGSAFPVQDLTVTDDAANSRLNVTWNDPNGPAIPANSPAYCAAVHPTDGLLDFVEVANMLDGQLTVNYQNFPSGKADLFLYFFYKHSGTNQVCDSKVLTIV